MTPAIELGLDPGRTRLIYEWDAMRYSKTLTPENLMESTAQATQRKITIESFDVIATIRPDIQCFNELLIQYPRQGEDPDKPGRVVPDNMVIVHPEPIKAEGSFMTPLQPVGATLVLEYVSKSNDRKDYEDNHRKYEEDLKVPFYLTFNPDIEELRVFRMTRGKYLQLAPNSADRLAIPDLELEVALLDGWVRFWFRGELVPLTPDLVDQVQSERTARIAAEKAAKTAEKRATTAEKRATTAEQERDALAAELARLRNQLNPPK